MSLGEEQQRVTNHYRVEVTEFEEEDSEIEQEGEKCSGCSGDKTEANARSYTNQNC